MLRYVKEGKSKVMVMNGEEGLECEIHVDGACLEHVSEFRYLGCVLDNLGTDRQNVVGRWQVPLGPFLMLGICRLSVQ